MRHDHPTPAYEPWTAVPHHQLAYAHERIAELEAENARLRELVKWLLDNPSDDPRDAVEDEGLFLTPRQWARRAAVAALTQET